MSTIWIISRHPGAMDWLRARGIAGQHIDHLDVACIASGDTVIGTLPVNIAAEVCAKGAAYWHLSLEVPFAWRGLELTPEQMEACSATLKAYRVQSVPDTGQSR